MNQEKNYHFSVATTLEERRRAIQLHYDRYVEVGFFQNGEKDPFEQYSTYFVAKYEDTVVGVIRLIFKPVDELPTMKNFVIYDVERKRISNLLSQGKYAESSAFTKMPAHNVSSGLINIILEYSYHIGITHLFCCLDRRAYRYMIRFFSFPLVVIGEPKTYLGSVTIPCIFEVYQAMKVMQDANYQSFFGVKY